MATSPPSDTPPGAEWEPLANTSDGAGYLSVYLSEPIARYPIRYVTKRADNKSDPNIETRTYGLFSTCERQMRGKLVREGRPHIFFVTTHGKKPRALTGYYKIGWYAESTEGAARGDFALAASSICFVDPIPLAALPATERAVCAPWFRTIRPIEPVTVKALLELLDNRPDRTADYLTELSRIERLARHRSGYTYPSWGKSDGFSLEQAAQYIGKAGDRDVLISLTGYWYCSACKYKDIKSKVYLKSCPICRAMGTLTPAPTPQE